MKILPLTREEEKAMGFLTIDSLLYTRMRSHLNVIIERQAITPQEKIEITLKLANLMFYYKEELPKAFIEYLDKTLHPNPSNFTPAGYFLYDLWTCFKDGRSKATF